MGRMVGCDLRGDINHEIGCIYSGSCRGRDIGHNYHK